MHVELRVPAETVNDEAVLLRRWLVADATEVREGQELCEVETSKASYDMLSPSSGSLRIVAAPGEVPVGGLLALIGPAEEISRVAVPSVAPVGEPIAPSESRFSRDALALLAEQGIDKAEFSGRALVRREDVIRFLADRTTPATQTSAGRLTPLSFRKKHEIRALRAGHFSALPSTIFDRLPISDLPGRLDELSEQANVTVSATVVSVLGPLLRDFPELNSTVSGDALLEYEKVNVGVALDVHAHGLRVPVIHDADHLGLAEIAGLLQRLLYKYLNDSLSPADVEGATFTISDLSMDEVPWFIPVIAPSQAAILGIGLQRGWRHGEDWLTLALTYDHRVTEGRRAAAFLAQLRKRLTPLVGAAERGPSGT